MTPAGTIGIRGTRLDIFVGSGGLTSVVLLSGAARFCTPTGCEDLRRRCDVIVARPGGGVSDASRVNASIFDTVGTDQAFPFLSGRQRLSSGFQGFGTTSCGLGRSASKTPPTQGGEKAREAPAGAGAGAGTIAIIVRIAHQQVPARRKARRRFFSARWHGV